jgi:hypothetical protein
MIVKTVLTWGRGADPLSVRMILKEEVEADDEVVRSDLSSPRCEDTKLVM